MKVIKKRTKLSWTAEFECRGWLSEHKQKYLGGDPGDGCCTLLEVNEDDLFTIRDNGGTNYACFECPECNKITKIPTEQAPCKPYELRRHSDWKKAIKKQNRTTNKCGRVY